MSKFALSFGIVNLLIADLAQTFCAINTPRSQSAVSSPFLGTRRSE